MKSNFATMMTAAVMTLGVDAFWGTGHLIGKSKDC